MKTIICIIFALAFVCTSAFAEINLADFQNYSGFSYDDDKKENWTIYETLREKSDSNWTVDMMLVDWGSGNTLTGYPEFRIFASDAEGNSLIVKSVSLAINDKLYDLTLEKLNIDNTTGTYLALTSETMDLLSSMQNCRYFSMFLRSEDKKCSLTFSDKNLSRIQKIASQIIKLDPEHNISRVIKRSYSKAKNNSFLSITLPVGNDLINSTWQTITVDDLRLSIQLPKNLIWATRTDGDPASVGNIYHTEAMNFPNYMETLNNYIMAYDPEGTIRLSVSAIDATGNEKNTICRNDEEILSEIDAIYSLLEMKISDKWVWRDATHAYQCIMFGNDPIAYLECMTKIDDRYYTIRLRSGTAEEEKNLADQILGTLVVEKPEAATCQLDISQLKISYPEGWILSSHETSGDDKNKEEYVILNGNVDDGTRQVLMVDVLDIYKTLSEAGAATGERSVYNGYAGWVLVKSLLSQTGVDTDNTRDIELNGTTFVGLDNDTGAEGYYSIAMYGIKDGYLYRIDYTCCSTDVWSSEAFEKTKSFLKESF